MPTYLPQQARCILWKSGLSAAAEAAEARVRGYGSDAAVWEDVDARVRDESVLSAGYLAWCLRGGALIASALSSLPAWRSFDPLPVLEFWERNNKSKNDEEDDQNEQALAAAEDEAAESPPSQPA